MTVPLSFYPQVSVWADLEHRCTQGTSKKYEGKKVLVANGVLHVNRDEVFKQNQRGIGVLITQRKS